MALLGAALVASSTVLRAVPLARADAAFTYQRQDDPARTVVSDGAGNWLATFTDGAYTVTLAGPERVFSEPTAKDAVVTNAWVRVLPATFDGTVDEDWLARELADTSADIFATAMQYIAGAPPLYDGSGLQIAGEAKYGPLLPDGTRDESADFVDYLGVSWKFGRHLSDPKADHFRSLDCSGFMRMVWGYRAGLPMTYTPDGVAIPRHSWEMADSGPGAVTIPNSGRQVSDFARLAPGDLVFFDAKETGGGTRIDHVGMFLGMDTAGHQRFISSRQRENGPTFGDAGGASLLDGRGLYARSFRAARRW